MGIEDFDQLEVEGVEPVIEGPTETEEEKAIRKQLRGLIRKLARRDSEAIKLELAPTSNDPIVELKRLAALHWKLTQHSVRLRNSVADKKFKRADGKTETVKCLLPEDLKREQRDTADVISERAAMLERPMLAQLEKFEIYNRFLKDVLGCGVVTAAYLISEIDIRRVGLKPSNVRKYCGYAVRDGRADRRQKDTMWVMEEFAKNRKPHPLKAIEKRECEGRREWLVSMPSGYNSMLKTRLWQMMSSMRRAGGKPSADAPHGKTSKYLEIWYNAKYSAVTMNGMIAGAADSKGMRKAIDIFLFDLYTVWRALEGLEVWPSYYDARRMALHGGIPLEDQGHRLITVEEAFSRVGNVQGEPLLAKRCWTIGKEGKKAA